MISHAVPPRFDVFPLQFPTERRFASRRMQPHPGIATLVPSGSVAKLRRK